MRLKSVTILALMLLPMISQAQRQQYQHVNDISYTASADTVLHLGANNGYYDLTAETDVADFRIYNYAVSNQELRQLKQKIGK